MIIHDCIIQLHNPRVKAYCDSEDLPMNFGMTAVVDRSPWSSSNGETGLYCWLGSFYIVLHFSVIIDTRSFPFYIVLVNI
jgi:hypothetical protein